VDYIHYNPVKHGYVERASDWKYSSIHRYVKAGIMSVGWACGEAVSESGEFGER